MSNNIKKERVFSGVQPTGNIHIGNYIGALSVWAENQDKYNNIFCVVDLHGLTIPESIKPDYLRNKIREVAALYLACGIDPKKSIIFVQSQVSQHSELTWLLNCVTPLGWLERMTQYKSKSQKNETIGTGLLDYPVLMAADILLYQADIVPVGDDQKQHVEITRDIAQRFNKLYGELFNIPKDLIRKSGARIMAFDDPETKMSKSIGEIKKGHAIWLLDTPNTIKKTIMRATTDSGQETRFEHASLGVKNLLVLYETLTGKTRTDVEKHFDGKNYGFLKKELVDVVVESLEPIQKKYDEITSEKSYLDNILKEGKDKASVIAEETLNSAKKLMGLK
ncbi:MAG: tryptophan--tRNA ligase [Clostridiales bacterium]